MLADLKLLTEGVQEKAKQLVYQQSFLNLVNIKKFEVLDELNSEITPLFHLWE